MEVELKHFIKLVIFINCRKKKKKTSYLDFLNRQNKITCSTHPHNLYLQILSEIGIFGFLMLFFIFESFVRKYKNFFQKSLR